MSGYRALHSGKAEKVFAIPTYIYIDIVSPVFPRTADRASLDSDPSMCL